MGRHGQGDTHIFALDSLERVLGAIAPSPGIGVGAGDERHILADGDIGLLVVQRQQAGGRQDVGVGLLIEGADDHRHGEAVADLAPAQGGAAGSGQRPGQAAQADIVGAAIVGQDSVADGSRPGIGGVDVAAEGAALVGKQPLDTEILAVDHFHLDNDCLHQHLGPADIQPVDDRLNRGHLVGFGRDDQ